VQQLPEVAGVVAAPRDDSVWPKTFPAYSAAVAS
jgi:hypothetical protein